MAAKESQFECDICKKVFSSKRYMNNHKITHSGSSKFTCSICGKLFTSTGNLKRHERVHTGDKPYECEECGTRFTEKGSLSKHMIKHTNDTRFQCEICKKIFTQKGHLDRHRRTHSEECPYECADCGKKFKEKSFLKAHTKIHSQELPFECYICHKKFLHKVSWKRHMVRKHLQPKPRACASCGECFPSQAVFAEHKKIKRENLCVCLTCKKLCASQCRLNIHMKTHTKSKVYKCLLCEEVFPIKKQLLGHLVVHTNNPYSCAECGEGFRSMYMLKIHSVTHTGEDLLHCSECGKAYLSKDSLQYHKETHRIEKRYGCPLCDKKFMQSRSREKHIMQVHMTAECYPCAECGEVFPDTAALENHKEVHELGEFVCSNCDKVFYRRSSLISHMNVHVSVKRYSCSQCGKKFNTINGLDLHTRIHTGERPFRCPVCGKGCARSGGLKRHMKIHSGNEVNCSSEEDLKTEEQQGIFQCSECEKSFSTRKSLKLHKMFHAKGKIICMVCDKEFTEKRAWRNHLSIHSVFPKESQLKCESGGFLSQNGVSDILSDAVSMKVHGVEDTGSEFVSETVYVKQEPPEHNDYYDLGNPDSPEESPRDSSGSLEHSPLKNFELSDESYDEVTENEEQYENIPSHALEPEVLVDIKKEPDCGGFLACKDEHLSFEDAEYCTEQVFTEPNVC